jgi:hypothetical protein
MRRIFLSSSGWAKAREENGKGAIQRVNRDSQKVYSYSSARMNDGI